MNISFDLLPLWVHVLSNIFFLGFVLLAAGKPLWDELLNNPGLQHRVGVALILLILAWSLRAGVSDGLGLHFFMLTSIHLLFGWRIAIVLVAFVQLAMIALGRDAWLAFGINGLISGIIPIFVTFYIWRYVDRQDPPNPFVFIFGISFFGAMLGVVASALVLSLLYMATGTYELDKLLSEVWAFIPLVALPEGVLNGMVITGFVVFYPEVIKLFDERRYFKK